jgi:hypothetical protein
MNGSGDMAGDGGRVVQSSEARAEYLRIAYQPISAAMYGGAPTPYKVTMTFAPGIHRLDPLFTLYGDNTSAGFVQ